MANNENQELNKVKTEDEFIREKILSKRKKNVMKKVFTVIFVLLCGIVFGFAARMSALFTDSRLKDLFGNLDNTPTPSINTTVPSEAPNTNSPEPSNPIISSVPVTFTPKPTDVTELSPLPTLEPIEGEIEIGVINPEQPHPNFSYSGFYKEVTALAEAVRPQVAEITAVKTYIDWFGDMSHVNTQTSGLILANNGVSLLILVDYNAISGSDSISVKVMGKEAEGSIYAFDPDFGLAVLSIDYGIFSEEERENIKYAKLYPDSYVKVGSPVVAVGNANGYAGSIAFGLISGAGYKTYVTDGMVKYFTTDWMDYKNSGAFIYDMSGAVCGMVTHAFKHNPDDGITTCISLEALRDVITALLNGRVPMYAGISCGDMTAAISEESGLNFGIVIRDVKGLSPAVAAGLRSGDIIVAINEQRVQSASELTMYLASMGDEETITIDYRRIEEEEIRDERVLLVPLPKSNHAEQKGK